MAGDAIFLKGGKGEKLALPRLSKPDVVDSPVLYQIWNMLKLTVTLGDNL